MSRIIVGVDGSEHGAEALRWAASRAERRGGEVVAILVWNVFDQGYRAPGADLRPTFADEDARRVLDEAVEAAHVTSEVTKRTASGQPAEALVEAAGPDDLVVVGARGLGGFKGLLLGSVSQRVLELATCPVAVIHGEGASTRTGAVVVGIDGSERSIRALHWAAAEAASRVEALRIVHAWQVPAYADMAVPAVLTALGDGAAKLVAGAAADPSLVGLTVVEDVVCGSPANALLANDRDTSMIVVASRGLGLVKRILLGSTSRQVSQHARVPVVVVPDHSFTRSDVAT